MGKAKTPMHYVCTFDEALKKSAKYKRFWVSNCGCRESGKGCKRSRMDVCLFFAKCKSGSGSGIHPVSKKFVDGIFKEAKEKHLVARPFHDFNNMPNDGGICFCCDDCCGYFHSNKWANDKGKFIEKTNKKTCTNCGDCVKVCYFKARKMKSGKLVVQKKNCYGCGLCIDICPDKCIQMVLR